VEEVIPRWLLVLVAAGLCGLTLLAAAVVAVILLVRRGRQDRGPRDEP
jgi:hypothetical protein